MRLDTRDKFYSQKTSVDAKKYVLSNQFDLMKFIEIEKKSSD